MGLEADTIVLVVDMEEAWATCQGIKFSLDIFHICYYGMVNFSFSRIAYRMYGGMGGMMGGMMERMSSVSMAIGLLGHGIQVKRKSEKKKQGRISLLYTHTIISLALSFIDDWNEC